MMPPICLRHVIRRVAVLATGVLLFPALVLAVGPDPILLWPDGAPGAQGQEDADRPAIRTYRAEPQKDSGACVVICPGGGYGGLATDHEGHQVAEWFKTQGVNSVVLRYRLGPKYHHPIQLGDVSRAIRYVRGHAAEWKIDPARVGVMGFSAGGHLASTVSTHFDAGQPNAADPIDRFSCRPDFAILAYPVISFTADFSHRGSARNLLGDNPDQDLLNSLSNETQVTAETPPTFLFHTAEDSGVPVANSIVYFSALVAHHVPAELHVYQNGPHGVGLAIGDPVVTTWKERLMGWLQSNGFLVAAQRAAVKGNVSVHGQPLAWGTVTFVPHGESLGPVAAALAGNGSYSIAESRGPIVGINDVVIRTMGGFTPDPSIADAAVLSDGQIRVDVQPGENQFSFELP